MSVEPAAKRQKGPQVQVMINGLPGGMGQEIAKACLRAKVEVVPFALTGPNMPESSTVSEGTSSVTVELSAVTPAAEAKLADIKKSADDAGKILVAIDFTHPSAVNSNAELYTRLKVPFVMGTTGGDREKLVETVKAGGSYALIAPNMCKQIVALQATIQQMSEQFPASFNGYSLEIDESHQSTKADTSGTAKAMLPFFNALKAGEPLKVEQIKKRRTKEDSMALGVPEESLTGHAWHTYTLRSGDGSVAIHFRHNVNGRRTYAEGAVDAVNYLASKIAEGSGTKLYDMIDVLKAGAMRD